MFLSPVHLTDKRESRSLQVSHLLTLTVLAACNGQTVSQRREKEITCGLKQNPNNNFMINYKTLIFPVKNTRTPNSSQGQKQTLDKNMFEVMGWAKRGGLVDVCGAMDRGRAHGKRNHDINAPSDGGFLSSLVGGRLKSR